MRRMVRLSSVSLMPFAANELNSFYEENKNQVGMPDQNMRFFQGLTQLASDENIQSQILQHEAFKDMLSQLETASHPQGQNIERNLLNFASSHDLSELTQFRELNDPSSSFQARIQVLDSSSNGNQMSRNLEGELRFDNLNPNQAIPTSPESIRPSLESSAVPGLSNSAPFSSTNDGHSFFHRVWDYVRSLWSWLYRTEEETSPSLPTPPPEPDSNFDRGNQPSDSFGCPGNPPKPQPGYGPIVAITVAGIALVLLMMVVRRNHQKFNLTTEDVREFSRLLVMSAIPKLLDVDKFASI
jgi:hypothetical protein